MRVLHFADAHIDMANYGRHDPESGLPLRVLDFLKSLDAIVDAAIKEEVDLVLFAGDAYKDRAPAPTFQREWGKRIIRLSKAGISTLLLIGNHDSSPALGRASAIHEFDTLDVPKVYVISEPSFLSEKDLGLPVQIIALPWLTRARFASETNITTQETTNYFAENELDLVERVNRWLADANPLLPIILTAHASVQGARYGSERTVMLGNDLVYSSSFVMNPQLDYVALGHIHKPQNLNKDRHPPVIYPGSIERVDFSEAEDDKYFIIANVERGKADIEWHKLEHIRPFIDRHVVLESSENVLETLNLALPNPKELEGAIIRLTVEYPRELETLIDETTLRANVSNAFEFHLVRRPRSESRLRLPDNQTISSMSPMELLAQFWRASHTKKQEFEILQRLAAEILEGEFDTR